MEFPPSGPPHFSGWLRGLVGQESLGATQVTYPRNSHVYNSRDRDHNLYLIELGQVKTVIHSRDGKQCLLSIYGPGDVFGEQCICPLGRNDTATAMRRTLVWRIPASRVRRLLTEENVLESFLDLLTCRMSEQQQTISNLVTMDSERRLAATLLALAHKLGKRQTCGIRIEERITQEELSGMVGTTRSRVGYFLKRFSEAGLVQRTKDSFLVIDDQHMSEYLNSA